MLKIDCNKKISWTLQMISSCLNKREVIKVFSVGRRFESEEEEKKVPLYVLVLDGGTIYWRL